MKFLNSNIKSQKAVTSDPKEVSPCIYILCLRSFYQSVSWENEWKEAFHRRRKFVTSSVHGFSSRQRLVICGCKLRTLTGSELKILFFLIYYFSHSNSTNDLSFFAYLVWNLNMKNLIMVMHIPRRNLLLTNNSTAIGGLFFRAIA